MRNQYTDYQYEVVDGGFYVAYIDPVSRECVGGVHYPTDREGNLQAPCACDECRAGMRGEIDDRAWGQGHFLCEACPLELLQAERAGIISAGFSDRWTWSLL